MLPDRKGGPSGFRGLKGFTRREDSRGPGWVPHKVSWGGMIKSQRTMAQHARGRATPPWLVALGLMGPFMSKMEALALPAEPDVLSALWGGSGEGGPRPSVAVSCAQVLRHPAVGNTGIASCGGLDSGPVKDTQEHSGEQIRLLAPGGGEIADLSGQPHSVTEPHTSRGGTLLSRCR